MGAMWDFVENHWRDGFEILILALVIYFILRFIQGTRGARVLTGLVALFILLWLISQFFRMEVIGWLLENSVTYIVLAMVIIFQPELRRALAEVGTQPFFYLFGVTQELAVVDTLVRSVLAFSSRRVGSLIAVEREMDLRKVAEGGAILDARLSEELLEQIFFPNSPLHDGGVIIQNNRVHAAACIFPLTQRTNLPASLGTRHRAALGLAEESDAVTLVVSEETGRISVASHGDLKQHIGPEELRVLLTKLLVSKRHDSWMGKIQLFLSGWKPGHEAPNRKT